MPIVDGIVVRKVGETQYSFFPGTTLEYPPQDDVEIRLAGPLTTLEGLVVSGGKITGAISPDPLEAGKAASITFNIAPENVSGNVVLTDSGDGLTWTFMVPEIGNVSIGATDSGFEPFISTYTPDATSIEPVIELSEYPTYSGQTVSAIPNSSEFLLTSNYQRAGRTISSVQLRVNGANANVSRVLADGDVVDVLVTDSAGSTEVFVLSRTQYALKIANLDGGKYRAIDDNPLLPDDLMFSVRIGDTTTLTSQARLAAGPECWKSPAIARVGDTYTATPGGWFSRHPGALPVTGRWLKNGTPISGATSLTLAHIADFDGATISYQETATDASGTRSKASTGISNGDVTAPVLSAASHDAATNVYSFSTTKPGTAYWAAYANADGMPTVDNQGVWTGTVKETGSTTYQTAGTKTLTPGATTAQADRMVFAIVDAAGNVSNQIVLPYAPLQASSSFAPLAFLAAYDSEPVTSTKTVRTYPGVSLGAAHAERDIFVATHFVANNASVVSLKIGGITATLVEATKDSTGSPTTDTALFRARVPAGTLADIEVTQSASHSSIVRIAVLRGVNIQVSDVAKAGTGQGSSVTASLDTAIVGHKIFGILTGGLGGVTWSEGDERYDVDFVGNGRWASLVELTATDAAKALTATHTGTDQSRKALIVFAAGEAA